MIRVTGKSTDRERARSEFHHLPGEVGGEGEEGEGGHGEGGYGTGGAGERAVDDLGGRTNLFRAGLVRITSWFRGSGNKKGAGARGEGVGGEGSRRPPRSAAVRGRRSMNAAPLAIEGLQVTHSEELVQAMARRTADGVPPSFLEGLRAGRGEGGEGGEEEGRGEPKVGVGGVGIWIVLMFIDVQMDGWLSDIGLSSAIVCCVVRGACCRGGEGGAQGGFGWIYGCCGCYEARMDDVFIADHWAGIACYCLW